MDIITASKKINNSVFVHIKGNHSRRYWTELNAVAAKGERKVLIKTPKTQWKTVITHVPFSVLVEQLGACVQLDEKDNKLYDIDDLSDTLKVSPSYISHNPDEITNKFGFKVAGVYKRKKLYTKI